MSADERRACVECKWCVWPPEATGNPSALEVMATCEHYNLADHHSMVTGVEGQAPCITTRVYGGCGELGLWWEPRKGASGA